MNVLRGVAALLSHKGPRSPLPLVKDGDLLATIHSMLCLRGFDTVHVSKVKGHATRALVDTGDVRLEDLVGNNGADAAADLGRSRQQDDVITARRTAPDAMVWDKGVIVKTRAPSFRLIVDHATIPGPPGFLSSTWCTLYPLPITQDDVAVWPYSVDILLVFSSFLASLHWPQGSFAPTSVPVDPWFFSGFPVGTGQEIRHGCQFLHSLFRAFRSSSWWSSSVYSLST